MLLSYAHNAKTVAEYIVSYLIDKNFLTYLVNSKNIIFQTWLHIKINKGAP